MKPLFTDTPEAWTRVARVSQSRADYASPLHHTKTERHYDRLILIGFVLVCALMMIGAI